MGKTRQDLIATGEPDIQSRILTIRCVQVMLDRDLGKKCFAFTRLDAAEIPRIVEHLA
jgi:hypothetical protein